MSVNANPGENNAVLYSGFHDSDPTETREWLESLDSVFKAGGVDRCQSLLHELFARARRLGVDHAAILNTPYCNTIPRINQPAYPGDLELEARITAYTRWNALAMVMRANKDSSELGGHLASYASAADLLEVGFNHFFRGHGPDLNRPQSDLVFLQPHCSPGIYARAFLEGRLSEENLSLFRQEARGGGLCSYAHPWLMPEFWQFPTGSMGIGAMTAIYQARFMRYLGDRSLISNESRRVWAFVGDGEMDEPESIGALTLAARENLDNLTFVVNCNLQRLDGPVRGNGSIVQELERLFTGAGWNVIKVLWGSGWDELFDRDPAKLLLNRFSDLVDGELQSYGAKGAAFFRTQLFGKHPELAKIVEHLSDDVLEQLTHGGHDPVKVYAALRAASEHRGSPSVVLALTRKGFGLGRGTDSSMGTHQQKKLEPEALLSFRDRFGLPLSDEAATKVAFCRPDPDSPEMRYMMERREELGGYLPARVARDIPLAVPERKTFSGFAFQQEDRDMSTTVALVRMMTGLVKNKPFGSRLVPIIADEARTFGMQSLFRQIGIYSHCGQKYEPADSKDLLFYKESKDGQILEEGISEAGALSSWIAAGTSYTHHAFPMVPVYIFYSIFGFQRVGDLIWAAADSRTRGFLVGATAGRTTLAGEGLQHQDGTSHLTASTVPNCRAYDPCFAYELAVIFENGLKQMLQDQQDVFYYITTMNENYIHPTMPADCEEGIIRGMYLVRSGVGRPEGNVGRVQLMGAGTILRETLAAAELLEKEWGIRADVWSVTSFTELHRCAKETDRWNRLNVSAERRSNWVEECLGGTTGPVIAASDYVRAVPELIRAWVPRRYVVLGTDGFGRSDTRAELRRLFEVDAVSIAFAAIRALVDDGNLCAEMAIKFQERHNYYPSDRAPWSDRPWSSHPETVSTPKKLVADDRELEIAAKGKS